MATALVTGGIFLVPTIFFVIGFRVFGRDVAWKPLLWAGFAYLVYILLLKGRTLIPLPVYLEEVPLIWFGKILSELSPPAGKRDHLTGQKRTVVIREVAN